MPLIALKADITTLAVNAVVTAANARLAGGGGVDGAVHRAAGPELLAACRRLGGCPVGEARITPGFRLKARHVIHAVGPVWQGGGAGEPDLLAGAYRHSLRLLRDAGGISIAFPAISTGVYGYPPALAVVVAVGAVRDDLAAHGELDVTFCCFDDATLRLYEKELAAP
ncbi:MAG: O-acetyl-ADP-ribose deacetylase [Acetobacteraceae bacterium]|nr:O-acetyl-ADP-ribose deacetylase [Acetobacteraceae bacterium]